MSQSNSENDIWEYKPLKKTKRKDSCTSPNSHEKRAKRKKVSMRCPDKLGRNSQPCTGSAKVIDTVVGARSQTSVTVDVGPCDDRFGETAASPEVYCPVCQMPFSILVVQSQRWHVADCSETPSADRTECPDGFQCSSSIPSHYKRYSHSLLAHSRAVNSTDSISLLLDEMQNISAEQKSVGLSDPISSVETSVDSAVNLSSASNQSVSPGRDPSGSPSLTNALLLLRSPDTRDIKKRKGWSPSTKSSKQQSDSQETRTRASTPVKAEDFNDAIEPCEVKEEPSLPSEEEFISYSPLSELPAEFDACGTQPRKALFQNGALGAVGEDEGKEDDVDDDSLMLFNDMMMSDDALSDAEPHQANGGEEEPLLQTTQNTCGPLMSSLTRPPHLVSASPTAAAHGQNHPHSSPPRGSKEQHSTNITVKPKLASPQSLVLERLREQIATSTSVNGFGATCGEQNLPVNNHNPVSAKQDASSPQTFPVSSLQPLASMAPRKTQAKAGPSSLKQTDIGVFFGLKPLKEKEVKAKGGETTSIEDPYQTSAPQGSSVSPAAITTKRQGRRQKNHAAPSTTEDSGTQPPQTEGGRGGARRRWNRRRTTDGEPEEPKRCPFYKKIPGTGFTVDAFRYGLVSGITAYFLTHFHSDHYGGLKKTSTFPIYCNKITGNLVKSKLKVDEQYVHILPMNTECTVQGVRVTLLDANHCPGAAMLLFLLPDGQTVLHTGDFRADPSMERYQELLGLRVQTLYLDTTYCSPEYTFPSQEEVITFAVNTAFELVTLTPRTLVVCGTYSVGKEKVFLAVSEVLGSKVFLSKDKYNTMCCLESEAIRKRITTDMTAAQVHVLPMMQVNFKNLHSYLNRFSGKYERIVAFKPTGWTFTQVGDVEDIQPQVQGNISIYGIPYSEHSSYLELKRFVQWLRPLKIIPTVNVGSWGSRKAMEGCFREWLTETQALAPPHPAGRGAAAPPTGSPPLKTLRLHQGVVPPAM